ncbi:MAG: alanine--tRNA ligase [Candidatus Pacebacteria bacterium]|nr:alanine--tRNA ligase [Candidatus Paceibacterota bacterium]
MSITADQLRQKYLQFFQERGHAVVPSASLVPDNDPTTLFTSAGMQWMLPYLLGADHPEGSRVANSQKCLRAEDIEEVGDNRHTTFFEMLGNWSFGDYFRQEQLPWIFEFLTEVVGLDPKRLYVTVFKGSPEYQVPRDQASIEIWQELFSGHGLEAAVVQDPATQGMAGRIFLYTWKNWWSRAGEPANMPEGEPGGPDSEIFYDFGPEFKLHENSEFADKICHVNCDCGRFLEIGNSVFMQFQKTAKGFLPLQQKNIDFGGGLERILAASQNTSDIFQTDLFAPIISQVEQLAAQPYRDQSREYYRIIADHLKAAVMLIADGVKPGNKEQGYVVRRLLRRAMRQAKWLEIEGRFLANLVKPVVEIYSQAYPKLQTQLEQLKQVVEQEEIKFDRTLNRGLKEFEQAIADRQKLTGKLAFKLYETYGFPLELSVEEANQRGLKVDQSLKQDFEKQAQEHAAQSRVGAEDRFKGGLADESDTTTAYHTATHLLHSALRQVLGEHVQQKGSNITQKRLRFDFSHSRALTEQEMAQVEELINQWIQAGLAVSKTTMSKNEAFESGALAFFGAKYPDQVTVYTIGQDQEIASKELCGGPHVKNTSELEPVEIFKEKSAAAGVRRIYMRFHK